MSRRVKGTMQVVVTIKTSAIEKAALGSARHAVARVRDKMIDALSEYGQLGEEVERLRNWCGVLNSQLSSTRRQLIERGIIVESEK